MIYQSVYKNVYFKRNVSIENYYLFNICQNEANIFYLNFNFLNSQSLYVLKSQFRVYIIHSLY